MSGEFSPVEDAIKEYLDDYELYDGEICHVPNEIESLLISDAVHGLIEDGAFVAAYGEWLNGRGVEL
jgi:hypothetical protein